MDPTPQKKITVHLLASNCVLKLFPLTLNIMHPFHLQQREIYEALATSTSHIALTATCRKKSGLPEHEENEIGSTCSNTGYATQVILPT
jgi:hypothetical protein